MSYFKLNWCSLAGLLGLSLFVSGGGHPAFAGTKAGIGHDIATTQGPAPQYQGKAPNWMVRVAVQEGNEPLTNACTGIFLSPEFVITATHCIPPAPFVMHVALGKGGSDDGPRDDNHFLQAGLVHNWGDVALLRVNGNIMNAGMAPLMHDFDFYRNENGTVMGYGATSYNPPADDSDKNSEQFLRIGAVRTGMESNLLPAGSGNKGISVHYSDAISRWGDSGGPLMLNPPLPEMLLNIEDDEEMLSKEYTVSERKVTGILYGGANNDVTYSELTPQILSDIAERSRISIFESPGDGHILVHDEHGLVKFSGWGPIPWGVSLSMLVKPGEYEEPSVACREGDMRQDRNDNNKWFCYFDIKNFTSHDDDYYDGNVIYEAKIIPVDPQGNGLDSCFDAVQNSDCVRFYYNVGYLAINYHVFSNFLTATSPLINVGNGGSPLINIGKDGFYYIVISGVPGSNINISTKSLSKYKGNQWEPQYGITETQHCYTEDNTPLDSVSVNPNGQYTCKLKLEKTPDNSEVTSIVRQMVSVWYADDSELKSVKAKPMNFRRVVDPEITMTITPSKIDPDTHKNIVMTPFDISGTDNITTDNGYLDETFKTIEIKTDNAGVSGFSEYANAPIKYNGIWSNVHYSFFEQLMDGVEFNTSAYLFINTSNRVGGSTPNGFNYVYKTPGLKINTPVQNVEYTQGQTINFNGTLESKHPDGTLRCSIYYGTPENTSGVLLEEREASVSGRNWSCPPINTQYYYDNNVENFRNEFDKHGRLALAGRIIHTVGDQRTDEKYVLFAVNPFRIDAPANGNNLSTTKSTTTDWVVIAPEYLIKGIGEPRASVNVQIPASSDCNITVAGDGTWNCGLQNTPSERIEPYTLNATQTTSDGRVAKTSSSFLVRQEDEDEELEEGGNGGDGNGGGINGNTGGGEAGTGTGKAPYLIFPATVADGALLSAAATTTAGLASVTGAAGAAGGAVATVGITITLGGFKILEHKLTPDWKNHGLWSYDIRKEMSGRNPLDSLILTIVSRATDNSIIGTRVIPLAKQVTIDVPAESQNIPYLTPYNISGQAAKKSQITVTTPGMSDPVCATTSDENGHWSCQPSDKFMPSTTGPVTIIATQEAPEGAAGGTPLTAERHFTVSVIPLTVSTPADKSTVIKVPYNVAGAGQPEAKIKVTIKSGDKVAAEDTVDVDNMGFWSYPVPALQSTAGDYTAKTVTMVDGKEQQDAKTVSWTVSRLINNESTVVSPKEGDNITQNTYQIHGTGKPGHRIDVLGTPAIECHTVVTDAGEWACRPIRVTKEGDAQFNMTDRDSDSLVTLHYTLAPSFTIDSPQKDDVLETAFNIHGRAPVGSEVKVRGLAELGPDCLVTTGVDGTWSCPGNAGLYPARNGLYQLRVTGTDSGGHAVNIIRNFAVNNVGIHNRSFVSITWPTRGATTYEHNFTVSGESLLPREATKLSVYVAPDGYVPTEKLCDADIAENGTWQCLAYKESGTYNIQAIYSDTTSNPVSSSRNSFSVLDTGSDGDHPYRITIDSPSEGAVISSPIYTISGKTPDISADAAKYMTVPECAPTKLTVRNGKWSCQAKSTPGVKTIVALSSRNGDMRWVLNVSKARHYVVSDKSTGPVVIRSPSEGQSISQLANAMETTPVEFFGTGTDGATIELRLLNKESGNTTLLTDDANPLIVKNGIWSASYDLQAGGSNPGREITATQVIGDDKPTSDSVYFILLCYAEPLHVGPPLRCGGSLGQ
ncbi:TPA: trypsin-like serine protease [Serratia fonticola]|nr:trypsin-like serine protease [Serratia fonticola]